MKKVQNVREMHELLDKAGLTSADHCIVKPNWFFQGRGFYTDVQTLQLLVECLEKVTVIEAYTYVRHDGSREITYENALDNWDWLKQQDERFLSENGLTRLFKEYDVEYVNVTEEVWSDRIADPKDIQNRVESKFTPVMRKELYNQIPQRLYDLRDHKLISFAKIKGARNRISGTLKNLFGLIIDPDRHKRWHGDNNQDLAQNIVDITKVYSSLFETVGLFEALYSAVHYTRNGKHPLPWRDSPSSRYNILENLGLVVYGDNLVDVDAYVCQLCGFHPEKVEHIKLAAEVFGKHGVWFNEGVSSVKQMIYF